MEQIFPFMGVRFISVNDGYDSADYRGNTGGLEMAFKNLIYDLYSKDLSVKVKSEARVRMKRGEYIGTIAPFGYQLNPERKGHLVIDPEASGYVHRIFELACQGHGTGKIARILNQEEIPTPAMYQNRKRKSFHMIDEKGYWYPGQISKILQDEVYLGIIVNHKTELKTVGGRSHRKIPEGERIYCKDMHQPIVEEEMFLEALNVIKHVGVSKAHKPREDTPLAGKVKCGYCKRGIRKVSNIKVPYYKCFTGDILENAVCNGEKLDSKELENTILNRIQLEITLLNEHFQKVNEKQTMIQVTAENTERELQKLKYEKTALYEEYKSGNISRTEFITRNTLYRDKEKELQNKLDAVIQEKEADMDVNDRSSMKCLGQINQLTRAMVNSMIERIYVYENKRIEIGFKHKCEYYK